MNEFYEAGKRDALRKFAGEEGSSQFEAWKKGTKKPGPGETPVRAVGWRETKLS